MPAAVLSSNNALPAELGCKHVWAPEAINGFILGRIVDIGTKSVTVEPLKGVKGVLISASYDSVFPAEEDETKDVDDNCALMYLNEATLLNNVRLRYKRDQIYTYVANILIAVNPYMQITNLYSSQTITKYQGKSLGVLPPHVFAIADKAYRELKRMKESQSIIVSGESGAGKTESQKYILRYLCESWGSHAGPIEQRILESNPILEAFGNARTLRNNNSSRFGKFVEIHFDKNYHVAGGYVSHYLLEKSRLCRQQRGERNYHIFYQLCAGLDPKLRQELKISSPDKYQYLKYGCTQYFCSETSEKQLDSQLCSEMHRKDGAMRDAVVDDLCDFRRLNQALADIGLTDDDRIGVFATVAALLHLGNVLFSEDPEDTKGGCCVSPEGESSLHLAALLLGVETEELRFGLTSRIMQASKGGVKGTVIRVPLKCHEAQNARDALAKAVYSRLFDYIVQRINKCIPFESSQSYIGVLDIAGFEFFTVNSFEQFCINYCNEKLQQFFNDRILKQEQELYEKEGLGVRRIEYIDNQDCIDLIEMKNGGILEFLDEESKLPRPNHQHFTAAVHEKHKKHFRLAIPRKSKLKEHRDIRDDDGFLIRHFAGAVCYQTALFLNKNNDALHNSLELLIEDSKSPLIRNLFMVPHSKKSQKTGKLAFVSVGSKFRSQLNILLKKLQNTGTHFVRCVKPNSDMLPGLFEGGQILSQLRCSGMTSVLQLMQQGYPSRTLFSDLYNMYKNILPADLARLDPRLFCKCLFKALGLNDTDFKFGLTKVFFRPGKFAEFDQLLRSDPENLKLLVSKVRSWLNRMRWKKAQWGTLSVIKLQHKIEWRRSRLIIIQSAIRGWSARKKHRHRYRGLLNVKQTGKQLEEMKKIMGSLQNDSKHKWAIEINSIEEAIQKLIKSIKTSNNLTSTEIDLRYEELLRKVDRSLVELRKQESVDERSRLRKIEEEMEREKVQQAREEEARIETERVKQEKMLMEQKRKQEEAKYKEQEEVMRQQQLIHQETNRKIHQQLEQEKMDHELAMRLAKENNSAIEEMVQPKPAVAVQSKGKYDLAKWRYADLRDVINTSNDIELLEACKNEFHRRLRIYNQWQDKNRQQNKNYLNQRAPDFIVANAQVSQSVNNGPKQNIQRYFRVPFTKPADRYRDLSGGSDLAERKSGWWYAHFDGQYIARQMEIPPDKIPLLLLAGRDDPQMCEMSLDQTGLIRKRGAEIMANEFEGEWLKHGGRAYVMTPAQHKL